MAILKNEALSPWISGVLIALLFAAGLYLIDDATGRNDLYAVLAEKTERAIEARAVNAEQLPEWSWQTAFLVGLLAGAAVMALAGKSWKLRLFPEDQISKGLAYYVIAGTVLSVAGGFLVMAGLILAGDSFLGIWNDCLGLSPLACFFVVIVFVEAVVIGAVRSSVKK